MNSNRALWQAGKLEMKGKLIVLDLMEVAVFVRALWVCVWAGVGVLDAELCWCWGCWYRPDAVHS